MRSHQRSVEWHGRGVAQVITREVARQAAGDVRMHEDEHVELLRALEHRPELRIRYELPLDPAAELDSAESMLADDAFEFRDCGIRVLHRQSAHAAQTVRTRPCH